MGYRQIRLHKIAELPAQPESPLHVSASQLENAHLKPTLHADGTIDLFDKDNNQEVLRGARVLSLSIVMAPEKDAAIWCFSPWTRAWEQA